MRVLIVCLVLSGCARYDRTRECQAELGPVPHEWMGDFGLIGAVVQNSHDNTKAYYAKLAECTGDGK